LVRAVEELVDYLGGILQSVDYFHPILDLPFGEPFS